ncbi:hypothetical protein HYX17_04415 [Candidatus Woesearchaeota archaeon]|nr:hypothetical protein [Candidatus Woesearchaeota archaeon]
MEKRGADNNKIQVVIIIFLLALGLLIAIYSSNTGFITLQHTNPELGIVLDKDSYDFNETINGNITIDFKGPVNAYTNLSISFGDFEYRKNIKEVIFQLGKTFSSTKDEIKAVNPSDSKIVVYEDSGKKLFGFKLPLGVTINSVDMNIFSELYSNSYPSSLSLDIGDDNNLEWQYLGEFSGWKENYIISPTLDISVTPATTKIEDNNKYYCSLLNLPLSRNFEISSNYRLFNETTIGGNITAKIMNYDLSLDIESNIIGNCDLPEPSTTFSWNSCSVSIPNSIEGDFLVCLKNENNVGAYRIASDFSSSQNTYTCDMESGCIEEEFPDYFIRARGANYNVTFTKPMKLSEANSNLEYLKNSIQEELDNCGIIENNFCIIPMSVGSASKGKIFLTELLIELDNVEYNIIYELINIPGFIYEINKMPIENVSLSLSLKQFNLTLKDKSETLDVALLPGTSISEEVLLFEFDKDELLNDINNLEKELNKIKINSLSSYFDYNLNQYLLQLNQYKSEASSLSNLSGSEALKAAKIIEDRINLFKNNLPLSVAEKEIVKDIIIPELKDLDNIVDSNQKSAVYNLQNKVQTNVEATAIESVSYSGKKDIKTLIKKTIIPKENLENVFVYEVIPKSAANSIQNVKLLDNFEVFEPDPVIRKKFIRLNKNIPVEFSYLIDNDIISQINELKTLILPLDIPKSESKKITEKENYECGDNICSIPFEDDISCPIDCERKIPWNYIIIGIVIILLGILYLNFYKGKFDFRTLTKGKNPFKNKDDLESVKKFIKNSLNNDIDKKNISKALSQKGWNKNQILYAFEDIEWEQRWVLIKMEAPDKNNSIKILKNYIKKCRKSRVDDNKIRIILSGKGWTEQQIDEGFKKAKKWF